jgi:hypothetical protein
MKTRSRQVLMIGAFALAACGDPTPSAPIRGQLTPAEVTGAWNISFTVDSVRECTTSCYLVGAGLRPIVTGVLVVSDQPDTLHSEWLAAELRVDFTSALGRQVTCLANPQSSLVLLGDSGIAEFWFTPGSADCGLSAQAGFDGREFHGIWGEASFTSVPLSRGTMRLWRQD